MEKRVGNRIRNKIISKSLAAFGFGQIQDAMNIIAKLKERNINIDGFMDWGRYMQLPTTKSVHQHPNSGKLNRAFICPDCALPLMLIDVNTQPCNIVGENYKSLLYCHDEFSCGYELYSDNDIEYWESLYGKIIRLSEDNKGKCGGCGSK